MFTFIKRIQLLLQQLKKNKGLFFSIILVISLLGIFLSMYIMLTMTSKVSQDIYVNMSDQYKLNFENIVDEFENKIKKDSLLILKNKNIRDSLIDYSEENIKKVVQQYNEQLNNNGFRYFTIYLYSTKDKKTKFRDTINTVFRTKESIFGIEVISSGVYIVLIKPVIKDEKIIGVLELKQSIHGIKQLFEANNLEYVFLLHRKMFSKLSLNAKTGEYKDVREKYSVKFKEYGEDFYSKISDMARDEFKEFIQKGFFINKFYYMTKKRIMDIGGTDVGVVVLGINSEDSKGFVKVADNMTKVATSVALGLIISIVLFLF
jgi:hypothetical protein